MTVRAGMRLCLAAWLTTQATTLLAGANASPEWVALNADHDDAYVYRLPYADSVSFAVLQSYGSRLSHRGLEYYTIDFGMPEGTLVYSAREGTVLKVEDRFDMHCWSAECSRYANYVEILHADGTIGKYFHLQQHSVLVRPGQKVGRGVAIARSGDTGYSTAPHLHFGVYRTTSDGKSQSIAVHFAVRGGLIGQLRAGARYINAAN
jgi:murein DD-endopeptidase MepM/ murein hydrolase activator NlpD